MRTSSGARCGWSWRRASRSRRWPGSWDVQGTLEQLVAMERRRREGGKAVLSEDERAELARLRKENVELG